MSLREPVWRTAPPARCGVQPPPGPAFANIVEIVSFSVTARKPAGIQRHLDDDPHAVFIGLLKSGERLLVQRVEKDLQRFALRRINDHLHFLAPVERNAIFADLSLGFEFFHFLVEFRSGPAIHQFTRRVMKQKDIHIVRLQGAEAPFEHRADVLSVEVARTILAIVTELGTENDILAHGLQSFAKQFLASSAPVAGRGVEEVAPRLERFLDNAQCFLSIVDPPIGVCQLPRSQTRSRRRSYLCFQMDEVSSIFLFRDI